jgi:hypothetical protein
MNEAFRHRKILPVGNDAVPEGALEQSTSAGEDDPAASCGKPKDQSQGLLGSRPQFSDQTLTPRTDDAANDQSDDDGVVNLAGDRDEVRDEIDR